MTNPFTKKVPNAHAYWVLLLITLTVITVFWALRLGYTTEQVIESVPVVKAGEPPVEVETKEEGTLIEIGAFSDVECGSKWCNRHEPKDGQIALNKRKWPHATQVCISYYDKCYRVVGTTYNDKNPDNSLDAEIWFGQDQQAALNFGLKKLRAYIK